MLPLGLLNAAQGHPILVELKNGENLNGHLVMCDTWMNLTLKEVVQSSPEGDKFVRLPEAYVKGNNIKYLRVPDEIIDIVKENQQNQQGGFRGGRGGRDRDHGNRGENGLAPNQTNADEVSSQPSFHSLGELPNPDIGSGSLGFGDLEIPDLVDASFLESGDSLAGENIEDVAMALSSPQVATPPSVPLNPIRNPRPRQASTWMRPELLSTREQLMIRRYGTSEPRSCCQFDACHLSNPHSRYRTMAHTADPLPRMPVYSHEGSSGSVSQNPTVGGVEPTLTPQLKEIRERHRRLNLPYSSLKTTRTAAPPSGATTGLP
ncbi:unnamed protein product [Parascedosporium putredinis]|uniref:Sm domain-containing protein n=1 Tax=Parascedosporium putredinis TaxID=1442378 RepID=A0A9P1M6T8_9PEZI|nr:unnamed protein product [Parascedosporium putredinis]CAI7987687.1 unnamed protein product [Parascedosporium putredinis]